MVLLCPGKQLLCEQFLEDFQQCSSPPAPSPNAETKVSSLVFDRQRHDCIEWECVCRTILGQAALSRGISCSALLGSFGPPFTSGEASYWQGTGVKT